MANKNKKIVNDSNYAPIHAIGAYLSQLRLKQKIDQQKEKQKESSHK